MYTIAFFIWALLCGNPNHNGSNHNGGTQVTTMDDTGGDTGHVPPVPPPPPPHG